MILNVEHVYKIHQVVHHAIIPNIITLKNFKIVVKNVIWAIIFQILIVYPVIRIAKHVHIKKTFAYLVIITVLILI